jgi:HlyD family secretion protein
MKIVIRLAFGIVAAAVLAAGVWIWAAHSTNGDGVAFRTAAVQRDELAAVITATGTVEPEEVIDVGAQVAGQIRHFGPDPQDSKRTVDYGTIVHPGTLLAQLDDSLFKARVDQAQATVDEGLAAVAQAEATVKRAEADMNQYRAKLNQAERDWERSQQLRQSRDISDLEYDTARAALETARANIGVAEAAIAEAEAAKTQVSMTMKRYQATLAEAQVNLGYTKIRSPVEGVIIDRRVNVGQTVVAGLNAPSLFLIAKDLKRLQVWASVNEADIGSIHSGQAVKFTVDAYPRRTFDGEVSQIRLNATMTQNVVTYTVVVTTDNADGTLLPYMTANLQFEVSRRDDALVVPNAALRWKPRPSQIVPGLSLPERPKSKNDHDTAVVWMPEGEFVRPVAIRVGLTDGAQTEVTAGDLKSGDNVVVGMRRLDRGDEAANPFTPRLFGGGKKE